MATVGEVALSSVHVKVPEPILNSVRAVLGEPIGGPLETASPRNQSPLRRGALGPCGKVPVDEG